MPSVKGADWADYFNWQVSQRARPLPKTHGLWCKDCRQSHPYNGHNKMTVKFEQRGEHWVMMFLCPRTSMHLGELSLGGQDAIQS
jgi:hypothetical protein